MLNNYSKNSRKRYRHMFIKKYIIGAADISTDAIIYAFDFCIRNYKKNFQPILYSLYRATDSHVS